MTQSVGDLIVNLDLNSPKFTEQLTFAGKKLTDMGQAANEAATQTQQAFSRQEIAAKRAGISVGQYSAAMRTLPAQFTDIATQLAGGQSPWLILLQQGGQIKDSFGGLRPMFSALMGTISPVGLGVGALAAATAALAYSFYQGSATLSDFNKTLILSGNSAGLTAQRMLAISVAGERAGLTVGQTSEALTALVNAGVNAGANFDALSVAVARFTELSGLPVDKVADAFGKLVSDPTAGLIAMAQQFHNVTAEQIAFVAQLQRSGDAAGALTAANDLAAQGFNRQTHEIEQSMGTLQRWAHETGNAFSSMWDKLLDIGRPDTGAQMLKQAQQNYDIARKNYEDNVNRAGNSDAVKNQYKTILDRAAAALSMAQQQADIQASAQQGAQEEGKRNSEQLKYAQQAQANFSKTQTALQKYTARQEELNKALKEGRILQADYAINMAAAEKEYEDSLKKPPKARAYTEDAGVRLLDQLNHQNEALRQQMDSADKLTSAAQNRIRFEETIADLKGKKQLSAEQKSLLGMSDQLLAAYRVQEQLTGQVGTLEEFHKMQAELQGREEKLRDVTAERLKLLERMRDTGKLKSGEYEITSRQIAQESVTDMPRDVDRITRNAGSRGSLAGTFSGDALQLDQLNQSQKSLEEWYSQNLASLAQHRQARADLTAQWDAEELKLRERHARAEQSIEDQKSQIINSSIQSGLGSMVDITRTAFGEKSAIYRATFIADKAFAIAQATLAIQTGIAQAAANPFPYNLVAMASVAAATASIISGIQSVAMVGMAHDGIDSIPQTGTWLLQKGERVTTASTSAKLDATLDSIQQKRENAALLSGFSYSPTIQVNGDPDTRTMMMMEEAVKRGAKQGHDMVVSSLKLGKGEAHKAVNGLYAKRKVN